MNILGIIFSYNNRGNLKELTKRRTLAALPLAGKYRIIDFALSNFVNNDIHDIAVITRNNYHSLMDHLGQGKEWDLVRKQGGLKILTPYARTDRDMSIKGTVGALASNMYYFRRSRADYVILTDTSLLYKADYEELVQKHIESRADITALYSRDLNGYRSVPMGVPVFDMDPSGRITGLSLNTDDVNEHDGAWGMQCFIMKKDLLETLVADAVAYDRYDFNIDIIQRLATKLLIKGIEYKGGILEISSATGYMKANMNFLHETFRQEFFSSPVLSKVKDSVPARYFEGCEVANSIIADECRIQGTVENSILSRGVRVGKNSVVKDCVIMQNTEIQDNVTLQNVIVDKDVIIRNRRSLTGHPTYPVIVEKASIV